MFVVIRYSSSENECKYLPETRHLSHKAEHHTHHPHPQEWEKVKKDPEGDGAVVGQAGCWVMSRWLSRLVSLCALQNNCCFPSYSRSSQNLLCGPCYTKKRVLGNLDQHSQLTHAKHFIGFPCHPCHLWFSFLSSEEINIKLIDFEI